MIVRKEEFCAWVEQHKIKTKQNYIDSVLDACDRFKIQEEFVPSLLNDKIIQNIQAEAKELNYLPNNEYNMKEFL